MSKYHEVSGGVSICKIRGGGDDVIEIQTRCDDGMLIRIVIEPVEFTQALFGLAERPCLIRRLQRQPPGGPKCES